MKYTFERHDQTDDTPWLTFEFEVGRATQSETDQSTESGCLPLFKVRTGLTTCSSM